MNSTNQTVEQQSAVETLKQWRANPALRPTHGLRSNTRPNLDTGSSAESVKTTDPLLEGAIKRKWDSDPAIRSEFGKFETYRAYAIAQERGLIRGKAGAVQSVSAGSYMAPPEAPAAATPLPPAVPVMAVRIRRDVASSWPGDLQQQLQLQKTTLMESGKSYGDSFNEAMRLVVSQNLERFG